MHILYLCQYFPPEMGAPAARAYEFGRRWVRAGHRVSVICGIPNHPHGAVYPGYAKQLLFHEQLEGIEVYRAWVYVTPNSGFVRRTLNYISFAISSVFAAERVPPPDVVIATSPQFFTGLSGIAVKRLQRAPLVLEIRDLWPDSIDAVDIRLGDSTMKMLRRMESYMYRKADEIVIVSDAFRDHIVAKGIPTERIHWVPNGVSTELFKAPEGERKHFTGSLSGKFLVGYFGTHGMAMGLETMLDAARNLKDSADIHFILVGEGAEKRQLMQSAYGLDNVTFIDRQPRETIAEMLGELDVALVLLKKAELLKTVIPSKMFEIMGCARPMILGVEGEAKRIMTDANAGIAIEPENAAALTAAILRLKENPGEREWYGINASQYVGKLFNLDVLTDTYLHVLNSVTS